MHRNPVYEFGAFRLDPRSRALVHLDSGPVQIAPRAFEALRFLLENPGRLVEKSDLMAAVWPNAVVEENSLSQCIAAIRRALGERPGDPRFVMTVPGRGFQFVAPVEVRRSTAEVRRRDAEAHDQLLRAQALLTQPNAKNLSDAAELFRAAIARDKYFARAYLGLAHTLHLQIVFQCAPPDALGQCEHSAREALAIDPLLAQGHALLGIVGAHRTQWQASAHHFEEALRLDPRDPQITLPYVMNLLVTPGYLRKARDVLREALEITPALAGLPASLAMVSMLLGDDAESRRYVDIATALGWPSSAAPLADAISQLALRAGRYDEASAVIIDGLSAAMLDAGAADSIRLAFRAVEDPALRQAAVSALRALELVVDPHDLDRLTRHRLILWYTQLAAHDAAFESARRSLEHFSSVGVAGTVWNVLWTSEMKPFRSDPRFALLCQQLRLPAYWAANGSPDCEISADR